MCVTASTAVVLFSLGRLSNHAATSKLQHAIYDIIVFLLAFIFANRTLSLYQFSPSKIAVKKQTNLFSGK